MPWSMDCLHCCPAVCCRVCSVRLDAARRIIRIIDWPTLWLAGGVWLLHLIQAIAGAVLLVINYPLLEAVSLSLSNLLL